MFARLVQQNDFSINIVFWSTIKLEKWILKCKKLVIILMFEFSLFFTFESLFTMQESNAFSSQQVSLIILNIFMDSKKVVKVDHEVCGLMSINKIFSITIF
jgi:hypothetical protein